MGENASEKTKDLSFLKKHAFDINFQVDTTKYHLGEKIGSGAYGVVCDARRIAGDQRVAIKKIPEALTSLVVMKRTYREICILRHFSHDNVISILDLLLPAGQTIDNARDIYVVFDFMETDLHKLITSGQRLEEDHIKYLMYQLFCGLHYVHSAGVIHRDLKPANLLVNFSNCRLKIGDFGMARAISDAADINTRYKLTQYVMTRWYRAPELLMGQLAYCTAVDLWSCGCIMAEMMTRRPLFPGNSEKDQFCQLVEHMGTPSPAFMQKILPHYMKTVIRSFGVKQPRPLTQLVPQASRKALDLLSKLLVYEPERRFSARQALGHSFLNKYRQPHNEPTCPSTLDFSFDTELVGDDSYSRYRMALLRELRSIQTPHMSDHDYVQLGATRDAAGVWTGHGVEEVKQIGATSVRVVGVEEASSEFPMISADTPQSTKTKSDGNLMAQAALLARIFSPDADPEWGSSSKADSGRETGVGEAKAAKPKPRTGRKPGGTNWPDKGHLANIAISDHVKERLLTFLKKPKETMPRRTRRATPYQRKKELEQKRLQSQMNRGRKKRMSPAEEKLDNGDAAGPLSIARSKDDLLRLERWERLRPPQAPPAKPQEEKRQEEGMLGAKSADSLDSELRELLGPSPPTLEPFDNANGDEMQALSAHMDSALHLNDEHLPSLLSTPKGSGTGYGINMNLQDLEVSADVLNQLKSPENVDASSVSNFPAVLDDWNALLSIFGFEAGDPAPTDDPENPPHLTDDSLLSEPGKSNF